MSRRKEYEENVQEKLKELEAEIVKLKCHVKEVEAELLKKHHKKFEELHILQAKAKDKFAELLEAGDDAFDHLQENMEEYWNSVGREMKAFEDFFKKD
ncbi:MAG: hypothetical protein O2971_02920 [Proteobacteria bacterium]|nr:hypothetical protein [Pseudomonadota bacterium]